MLAIFFLLSLVNGLCYTPNGNLSNDVACNPDDPASICCTAGFLCMSNGLCQPDYMFAKSSNQFIRGTCTDKSWSAPECRGFCVKENPSGGEWVMRCNNATAATLGNWCCARDDCCDSNATKLKLGEASVTATAGVRPTPSSTSGGRTSTGSGTGAGISPTSAVQSSKTPSSETSSSKSSSSETSSPEPSSSKSSSSETSSPEPSSSGSNTLAIGLGVGLGGAVAVILAGFWIVWRKRRSVPQSVAGGSLDKAELDGRSEGRKQERHLPPELNGNFQGYQLPAEGERSPVELPGHGVHLDQDWKWKEGGDGKV